MKLVVNELRSLVEQEIQVGEENLNVSAIRPHLYRHNFPSGSIKIQVLDASKTLMKESDLISISDLDIAEETGLNFFHGYIRFLVNVPLKAETNYWIRLVGSGYTFSESAYVGWCNDYDLRKVSALYTPSSGWDAAMDLEIWTRTRTLRGSQA
jgi:hypothetical protein